MKYSPIIKKFPHFLHGGDYNPDQWLNHPEVIDEDFRLMPLAGCNTFSIGIFSWTQYEKEEGVFTFDWLDDIMDRLAQQGFNAFLATPSGAKPAWLAARYPEICRVGRDGRREYHHSRHNHCWSSPVYREKVSIINRKLAERYRNHQALGGWHISNEYNGECFCDLCVAEFHRWLEERYKTLDNLNEAWWSGFWNHHYTAFSEIDPRESCVDGLLLDWKRFNTWQVCDFMNFEVEPLREVTPDVPVTTNMMGGWYGIDYWRLKDCCDVISVDCYPIWDDPTQYSKEAAFYAMVHDTLRTMKNGKPFFMMESTPSNLNYKENYRLKRPGVHQLEMLLAMGHGADGTMYFQWRKGMGGFEKFHGAVVDHVGHENTRVFKDIAKIGEIHSKLDAVIGTSVETQTAVIHDWDSCWSFEVGCGPTSNNKKVLETIQAHYRALYNLNVPMDVIESTCDFSGYKLLIAPMLYMLKPGVAEKLTKFVAEGGTLVCTYLSGYVNETNLCFTGGWPGDGLQKLFGLWNEELDGFAATDNQTVKMSDDNVLGLTGEFKAVEFAERVHLQGAESLATFGDDFYAGEPALTVNSFGNGKAYYMAARTEDDFLLAFYRKVVESEKIETTLPLETPIGVHGSIRTDGERRFLFLYNFAKDEAKVDLGDGDFRDMVSGTDVSAKQVIPGHGSFVLEIL